MSLPTKVSCLSFTVEGEQISNHVNSIYIYENICKAYRTATAVIIDNNNVINTIDMSGGQTVSFVVISDGGGIYSATMQILSVSKEKPNYSLRTNMYNIEMIDSEYIKDRANLVQRSFKSVTGTGAISTIHNEFLGSSLSVLVQSSGLLWTKNPHIVNSLKPFTAIDDIRKMITFAGYPSGINVYYHDKEGVKLAPLEYLFKQGDIQTFIQKATWGAKWTDIFNSDNAIIASETQTKEYSKSSSIVDTSAASQGTRKVMDLFSNKRAFSNMSSSQMNGMLSSMSGLLSTLGSKSGGQGGLHNYLTTDSQKIPNANVRDSAKSNAFSAAVGNALELTIRVPAQTGFNVTVGKKFYAKMVANLGDRDNGPDPRNAGSYLATKIVHALHFDSSLEGGTSSLQGVKL